MSQCSKEIISVSQRHRITWGLTYNRSYTFVDFWEFNTYSAKCCGYRSIRVAIQTFGCQLRGITNSAGYTFFSALIYAILHRYCGTKKKFFSHPFLLRIEPRNLYISRRTSITVSSSLWTSYGTVCTIVAVIGICL